MTSVRRYDDASFWNDWQPGHLFAPRLISFRHATHSIFAARPAVRSWRACARSWLACTCIQVRTDAVRQALWQRNRTTAAGHHQRHRHQSKPHPRIVARPCPALDPTNCHQTAQRSRPHPRRGYPLWTPASTDPATSWRAGRQRAIIYPPARRSWQLNPPRRPAVDTRGRGGR